MSQIKIIKKKAITGSFKPVRKVGERSVIDSELSHTVNSWVADWRARKEAERQSALSELTRLTLSGQSSR